MEITMTMVKTALVLVKTALAQLDAALLEIVLVKPETVQAMEIGPG
jgi:hypothetical protein